METVKDPDSLEKEMERMVITYQHDLLRLCFAYLCDEELAKDALQETFLKAFRSLSGFQRDCSEKTWLTRIAINTCKDIRRSAWFRYIAREITLDMLPEPAAPVQQIDVSITLAVLSLPPKLKEAALLCWYQEMSYTEAAQTLNISPQAVSNRMKRARKKLRQILEGSGFHDAL